MLSDTVMMTLIAAAQRDRFSLHRLHLFISCSKDVSKKKMLQHVPDRGGCFVVAYFHAALYWF